MNRKALGSAQSVFLSAYSPEVNPDESLNQDLKNNARRRQRAITRFQMSRTARSFMCSEQHATTVKPYFTSQAVLILHD